MPQRSATPSRTRPTRVEVRRRVLDAAFAVFAERGIAASSVSDVAAAAGLTKGAVYSNFASKDELVLALMDEHAALRVDAALAGLTGGAGGSGGPPGADPERVLADIAAALVEGMRADAAWHRLLAEFFALAHQDPDRRDALRARRHQVRDAVTRALEHVTAELGIVLPLPPPEMAVVLLALSNGLAVESDIDPGAVPDDLLGRVLVLIAGDAVTRVRSVAAQASR